MALTAEKLDRSSIRLAKELFDGGKKKTANLNLTDLRSAVEQIDLAMDHVQANFSGPTQTIKQHLIAALPEPFKSNSNATEKAFALTVWAMAESAIF